MNRSAILPTLLVAALASGLGFMIYTVYTEHRAAVAAAEYRRRMREEPQFHTGECVALKGDPNKESWEQPIRPSTVYIITKVGNRAYRTTFNAGYGEHIESKLKFDTQELFEQVDCDLY